MTVRVVIADDHPMYRFGLRAALEALGDVDVVGEASDGAELVGLVADRAPDVALTDLAMPGTDGVSAVAEISARFPGTRTLVLTMDAGDDAILAALRAGASGYLLKDAERDEIARAIRVVATGGTVFSGEVGARLVQHASAPNRERTRPFPELTERETEILAHIAAGRSNRDIAVSLFLAEKTVRNNVAMILAKLHLRDRAAAVAAARDHGLGAGR
ncbi:response regulator transcription factor [Agromyces marinus]|uniref:response regulator transcription factor n=1 Tax=Agromyces marinus TaxID=1389020 RepID=UPI001F2627E2|nr:response regulator transcription factor [Agromyces marinus]UIP57446.1 Transcriptional regulatory protein LiaR [Agromyces marinus]